jgi:hypothetical protein
MKADKGFCFVKNHFDFLHYQYKNLQNPLKSVFSYAIRFRPP